MNSLSCISKCRSSLLRFYGGLSQISLLPSKFNDVSGSAEHVSQFSRNLGLVAAKGNISDAPYALNFRSFIHSTGQKDFETGKNSKPMDFVRGIMEEDRASHFSRYNNVEQNADFVNIHIMRNNTFINVTDSKGNTKTWATAGYVEEHFKTGKLSRYASEATAEHAGRMARNLGVKSVVMKVKGFTYFKKKRQAIMSFREGFNSSRTGPNPIVFIEDVTRRPHNGCRLPKKRRI